MSLTRRRIPAGLALLPGQTTPLPPSRQEHYKRLRLISAIFFIGLFYLLPWLPWQQRQAVLIDLSNRHLHLFGWSLGTADIGLIACMMAALVASLVLATTLYGRRWCGFGCPQTLLGRIFHWIERATDAAGTLRLPARILRHSLWIAISLWTGITFVGYFSPIALLTGSLAPFHWSGWELFWAGFYALATWANIVLLRDQVCTYLCPYGRLHTVLHDQDTVTIGYDARRGEPRGPRAAGQPSVLDRARGLLNPTTAADYAFRASYPAIAGVLPRFSVEHLGDCTDCGACVQACPSRLDIRTGNNPACNQCGACADACNSRMASNAFPPGLVRPLSQNGIHRQPGRQVRIKVIVALAVLLLAIIAGALQLP